MVQTVVFALGPGSTMAHVDRLAAAMKAVASEHAPVRYNGSSRSRLYAAEVQEAARESASCQLPMMAMTPREAFFAATEKSVPSLCHRAITLELMLCHSRAAKWRPSAEMAFCICVYKVQDKREFLGDTESTQVQSG